VPTEFESTSHYLKDTSGNDVNPGAEELAQGQELSRRFSNELAVLVAAFAAGALLSCAFNILASLAKPPAAMRCDVRHVALGHPDPRRLPHLHHHRLRHQLHRSGRPIQCRGGNVTSVMSVMILAMTS
jgi:hypothetical protein